MLRTLSNFCRNKYYAGVFHDIQSIVQNTACKQSTTELRGVDSPILHSLWST